MKMGVGLRKILNLKENITSLYLNKVTNNNSVETGSERSDQKR